VLNIRSFVHFRFIISLNWDLILTDSIYVFRRNSVCKFKTIIYNRWDRSDLRFTKTVTEYKPRARLSPTLVLLIAGHGGARRKANKLHSEIRPVTIIVRWPGRARPLLAASGGGCFYCTGPAINLACIASEAFAPESATVRGLSFLDINHPVCDGRPLGLNLWASA
jgi:hypothetical protein